MNIVSSSSSSSNISSGENLVAKKLKSNTKKVHKAQITVTKFTVSTTTVTTGSLLFKGKTRRHPKAKLYAFPSFDKSDALVYFPCSFARLLNSSDFPALAGLLSSHLSKNCDIQIYANKPGLPFSKGHLLDLFELMDQVHPDSIACCHSTRVVENEIKARLYFKYTDCKPLLTAITRTGVDPRFGWLTRNSREDMLKVHFGLNERPQHEQNELNALLDSEQDLVVYGEVDLRLRFDDFSKKITDFTYVAHFTSLTSPTDPTFKLVNTPLKAAM